VFTDISVGQPGKHHDSHVLQTSPIFEKASNGQLFPPWMDKFDGVTVPLYLVGDPAYPLSNWLMKGFPGGGVSQEQEHFNYRLSRARMTIECAFGRLKGRWRCLLKTLDLQVRNVPDVVSACCILHNTCEIHGEYYDSEWMQRVADETNNNSPVKRLNQCDEQDAKQIRHAICGWVSSNPI